ncbi:MAG TPA: tRNA pseudouridine(55) synthase TruB [bacterium]|jgi:tRNA pseudouridine55 synthase|nr:tRNA pseudouridine(55) synthase TruB [bacterium]
MLDGFVNLLKPPGPSSHDLVSHIRQLTGIKRVGHTGTLDPLAAGVLVIAIGRATRLIQYLDSTKTYLGEVTFGIDTDTLDAAGNVLANRPVSLNRDQLEMALKGFKGTVFQVPPMVSALKWRGRRLYNLARAGIEIERPARAVFIKELELLSFFPDKNYPRSLIKCTCSTGTYMRALAVDIGKQLGCSSYLSFLLRVQNGPFSITRSLTLEQLKWCIEQNDDSRWLICPQQALSGLPVVVLSDQDAIAFTHGNPIWLEHGLTKSNVVSPVCVCDQQRTFLGVGLGLPEQPGCLRPKVVFN